MDAENKSKFDNYFIICFTTILGYFLKYVINRILINYKEYDEFFYYAIGLYIASIIISLFFYFLFDCTFEEEKTEQCENKDIEYDEEGKLLKGQKKNEYAICQICGISIYSQKNVNDSKSGKCGCC